MDELTGPTALTLDEVAAVLTRHLGRAVHYVEETVEEAYRSRSGYGAESWQLDAWVSTYLAIRDGELERVTPDVERIAGHVPMRLDRSSRSRGARGSSGDLAESHVFEFGRPRTVVLSIEEVDHGTDVT